MTATYVETKPAKRPARPFVPRVPAPTFQRLTSAKSKAGLIGAFTGAYLLQFGLGILTAVTVFVIRQSGELEEQVFTTGEYLATILLFGVLPFALSMTVIAVYRRRARWTWADLGVTRPPRDWFERRVWWRSSVTYFAALAVSSITMGLLSGLRGSGDYPDTTGAEVIRAVFILPESLMAGVGEELLLVGFLVVALERLGANGPTIYLVAVIVRIAFHVYYGPAVIALILWAVVAVWLFRRTRNVMPLIIVHTLWDVNAFSSEFAPLVTGLTFVVGLLCVVVTGIVHLVTRRHPDPVDGYRPALAVAHPVGSVPAGAGGPAGSWGPPPGWYPDPLDPRGWRWWDGHAWTPHFWPAPPR